MRGKSGELSEIFLRDSILLPHGQTQSQTADWVGVLASSGHREQVDSARTGSKEALGFFYSGLPDY